MNKITLKELAALTGGEAQGDPNAAFENAAPLDEAGATDIAFLADPKMESRLAETRAGCVLLEPSRRGEYRFAAVYVKEPKRAFTALLRKLEGWASPKRPSGCHPTAVISPHARLGRDVHVGPHAVIESGAAVGDGSRICALAYVGHGAVIGKDCMLYPHTVVRERCELGDRVILHSGVMIGADGFGYLPGSDGIAKIPQIGRVVLGSDVEVGANSTIDRATTGATRIGAGTKIDNLVQIAHNCRIGRNCFIVSQVGIAGSTTVGDGATLAGQVGISENVMIGAGAIIGAQGGVTSNAHIPEKAVLWGTPARPIREVLKLQALIRKLPEIYAVVRRLKREEKTST